MRFGPTGARRRRLGWPALATLVAAALLALPGCGGEGDDGEAETGIDGSPAEIPGDADPADVRVIDAWVSALASGDVDAAARYFAIPSIAENGPILVRIESLEAARRFNRSLPCGAELVGAETAGDFTTATFRLTERPGAGTCGSGTGETAATAFVIERGKIVEWRRVDLLEEPPETDEAV
jgi:limonene-1,2-epoxide hydrolase